MSEQPVLGRPATPFDESTYDEIVTLRKELRMSKYRCAQLIDVTPTAYVRYENEKDNFIGVDKQQELLDILRRTKNSRSI